MIGQLDDILTKLDFGKFEDHIEDIFTHSRSEGEMKIKMDNLIRHDPVCREHEGGTGTCSNSEIHQFLERYFTANECDIVENNQGYMNVQLTIDLG